MNRLSRCAFLRVLGAGVAAAALSIARGGPVGWRKAGRILKEAGIDVVCGRCDEILTVQEAAGFQLFLGVLDETGVQLLKAPSNAPYWVTR